MAASHRRDQASPTPRSAADVAVPQVSVRRSSRRKRTVTAYRDKDTIVVLVPQRMSRRDEVAVVDDMVQKVLAREARVGAPKGDRDLAQRAAELARQYLAPAVGQTPEPYGVVWVTNQQRRWGSCTPSTRMIRLSDRLKPMPSWVVDYVLLHELAHLLERGHTKAFWKMVERYPKAERARGFLEGVALAARWEMSADDVPEDSAAEADLEATGAVTAQLDELAQ